MSEPQEIPVGHLVRDVIFQPGFDHRDDADEKKRRQGCHGMGIAMMVRGSQGAVVFQIFTGWLPSWFPEESFRLSPRLRPGDEQFLSMHPMASDLGYHWLVPLYEGNDIDQDFCDYIKAPCYYEGSSLNAQPYLRTLVTQGGDAVWAMLEAEYRDRVEQGNQP